MSATFGTIFPGGWRVSKLKHCTSFLNRGTAPNYVDGGQVRAVSQAANRPAGLDWEKTRFHSFSGNVGDLRGYLHPHDILINSTGTGTLGRVGYFDRGPDDLPCMADGHITLVRAEQSELNPRFAYYWLSSAPFQGYLHSALAVGATNQIELSRQGLSEAPVPLPSLEEQRRIVAFLDAETARIDRASKLRSAVAELTAERANSLIESELFSVVDRFMRLRFLVERPLSYGANEPADQYERTWPRYLRTTDIDENGGLRDSTSCSLSPDRAAKYLLRDGDLLLTRSGATVGKSFLYKSAYGPAAHAGYLVCVRPDRNKIDPELLYYYFKTRNYWQQVSEGAIQSTIQNVSAEKFSNIVVPVPTVDDQSKFLAFARAENDIARRLMRGLQNQINLLVERRQVLITAAVTGQIDVTNARGVDVS